MSGKKNIYKKNTSKISMLYLFMITYFVRNWGEKLRRSMVWNGNSNINAIALTLALTLSLVNARFQWLFNFIIHILDPLHLQLDSLISHKREVDHQGLPKFDLGNYSFQWMIFVKNFVAFMLCIAVVWPICQRRRCAWDQQAHPKYNWPW